MAIAGDGGHASALRALQVALLDEVRLEHVLDGIALLADRRGKVLDPDRATREFLDDGEEPLAFTSA